MKKPSSPALRVTSPLDAELLTRVSGGLPADDDLETEQARKGKKNPSDQAGA